MNQARVPAALLNAVKSDLQPVRPLAAPMRRALMLLPLGIAMLVGIPAFWTWQAHLKVLAPWPSWLLSVLEIGLSLLILAASFREAIPGRELSAKWIAALVGVALMVFVLVNPTLPSPPQLSSNTLAHWMWECIVRATTFSIPALVLPVLVASRGLPNRPALMGALCGLGVGFMGDAGLRLLCWDGDYAHVILAHGGAIAILVGLGALSAVIVERVRSRRLTKRGLAR
ncbi:MAG TPA: NrsF family protein [Steroidobacteraceae bacterium]|nr:NrsF family protein [Steroidobacteraceae bacterium]